MLQRYTPAAVCPAMHLHPRLLLYTSARVQVADIKAALRQQGIRYPKGALKAELAELLRWSSQVAAGGDTEASAKAGTSKAAAEDSAGPTVSPETYGWDAGAVTGASAGGSAAAAAPAGGMAVSASSAAGEAARCAAGQYGSDEPVRPGIAQFEDVATAAEAAVEKEAAGENRAVEHVALHAEASMDLGAGGYDDNGAQAAGPATDTSASGKQKRQRQRGGEKSRARGGKAAAAENGDAAAAQGADTGAAGSDDVHAVATASDGFGLAGKPAAAGGKGGASAAKGKSNGARKANAPARTSAAAAASEVAPEGFRARKRSRQ